MLPAIVFLQSAEACNQLALELVRHLKDLEARSSSVTKTDLKRAEALEKALKRSRNRKDENNNNKSSNDRSDDVAEEEYASLKNPAELNDKYTFLDPKYKLSTKELQEEISLNKHRKNIPAEMFEAWKRGVGVHHASFHTKFRSSVECLFRK